jgi:TATA-binding protein-associated factor
MRRNAWYGFEEIKCCPYFTHFILADDFSPEANAIAHEKWCNDLAAKLLCIFVLDRFSDFVSDQVSIIYILPLGSQASQVVAPVRETVSQTLASLLLHMPRRSLLHVHLVLLQMIRQDFTANSRKSQKETDKGLIWEIRHAGLLGIKYEVAVRSDLFELVKEESDTEMGGREVLEGVVEAAILG